MRTVLLFLILTFFAVVAPKPSFALVGVSFSEVAWMGDTGSYLNEWIELYNPSVDQHIDLAGWTVVAADGSPQIELSGSLAPEAFLLLKRGADLDYTGSLSNGGETLVLKDSSGSLIDEVSWSDGSPGDNQTKHTMERLLSGAWETSVLIDGTPGAVNSVWSAAPPLTPSGPSLQPEPEILPAPEPEPAPEPDVVTPIPSVVEEVSPQSEDEAQDEPAVEQEPVVEPLAQELVEEPLSYSGLLQLSELLPNPSGKDTDEEFVELLNIGGRVVSLDGWALRDASGKTFRLSGDMPPGAFLSFFAADTSLPSLNNAGDVIELLDPLGARQDGISYSKALKGLSLVFVDGVWQWSSVATPNKKNVVSTSVPDSALNGVASPLAVAPPPPGAGSSSSSSSSADKNDSTESDLSQDSSFAAALHNANRASSSGSMIWYVLPLLALLAGGGVFVFRRRAQKRLSPAAPVFAVEETDSPPVT